MHRIFVLFTALVLTTGCSNSAQESNQADEINLDTLEAEIQHRLRTYEALLRNGDSVALGEMYTVDAEIIPSRAGREQITLAFGSMIRDGVTESIFETVALWGDNELLVEEGRGTWALENGEVVSKGRYLLVWKKEEGEWRILRDTWFPDK